MGHVSLIGRAHGRSLYGVLQLTAPGRVMEATPLIIPLLPSDISHYHPFLDFFNATCTSKAEEFDEIQLFIIVVYVI